MKKMIEDQPKDTEVIQEEPTKSKRTRVTGKKAAENPPKEAETTQEDFSKSKKTKITQKELLVLMHDDIEELKKEVSSLKENYKELKEVSSLKESYKELKESYAAFDKKWHRNLIILAVAMFIINIIICLILRKSSPNTNGSSETPASSKYIQKNDNDLAFKNFQRNNKENQDTGQRYQNRGRDINPDTESYYNTLKEEQREKQRQRAELLISQLGDKENHIRRTAASTLGEEGFTEAGPALVKALSDTDNNVRYSAMRAIGRIKYVEAFPNLVKILKDPSDPIRIEAVEILGTLQSSNAIPHLTEAYHDPKAPTELRERIAYTLGNLGEVNAVHELASIISDKEKSVRLAGVLSLGKIGYSGAVKYLVPLLQDPDKEVKTTVIRVLSRMDSSSTVPALIPLLNDPDKDIRELTRDALLRLKEYASDRTKSKIEEALTGNGN